MNKSDNADPKLGRDGDAGRGGGDKRGGRMFILLLFHLVLKLTISLGRFGGCSSGGGQSTRRPRRRVCILCSVHL